MTLQTIFEQNREHLLSAISGTAAVAATRALNSELDRILYTFNDQEENARVREAAGSMIQVAKAACSLVDSDGETKVYGRTDYSKPGSGKQKVSKGFLLLLILGLIGAAATVIGAQLIASSAAAGSADWQSAGLPPRYVLALVPLLTVLLFFFAGTLFRRRKETSKETLHAETTMDTSKIYNHLLAVILVIDKQLEDVRNSVRQEERERLKDRGAGLDPAELDLLSQLLEDAYGRKGRDEQADEEISQIKFYLHKKNIDVVDWSADAGKADAEGAITQGSGWFDMIPAYTGGTIRPAIAADGKLLKKGMASAGKG